MSLQVEKLEKNMAKLTVEVPAEQFEAALKTSYNKNIIIYYWRNRITR